MNDLQFERARYACFCIGVLFTSAMIAAHSPMPMFGLLISVTGFGVLVRQMYW